MEDAENICKRLEEVSKDITMKIYEADALLIQVQKEMEDVKSIKFQLEESHESFKNNARNQEHIMRNYERLANRCSALEKKLENEHIEVEKYTVEEVRKRQWIAIPEDYEVKCIWSRCERDFKPFQYKAGKVICPHCNRETPVETAPEGKKWMYFWNCWHIHSVPPEASSEKCWTCGKQGDLKESNIRVPTRKK